jgi:hypothetical protein
LDTTPLFNRCGDNLGFGGGHLTAWHKPDIRVKYAIVASVNSKKSLRAPRGDRAIPKRGPRPGADGRLVVSTRNCPLRSTVIAVLTSRCTEPKSWRAALHPLTARGTSGNKQGNKPTGRALCHPGSRSAQLLESWPSRRPARSLSRGDAAALNPCYYRPA